jgi:hypothetical protein
MTLIVFAALIVTAVIALTWGTVAVALPAVPTRAGDDGGNRGHARLVNHACSPPHVVIAGAAPIERRDAEEKRLA